LEAIGQNETIPSLIRDFRFIYRNERIIDTKESEVLKLTLSDSTKALTLAKRIEKPGNNRLVKVRLYNVDLLPVTNVHGLFHTLGIPVSSGLGVGFLAGFVSTR